MFDFKSGDTGYVKIVKLGNGIISLEPCSDNPSNIRPLLIELIASRDHITYQQLFDFLDCNQITTHAELVAMLRKIETAGC